MSDRRTEIACWIAAMASADELLHARAVGHEFRAAADSSAWVINDLLNIMLGAAPAFELGDEWGASA